MDIRKEKRRVMDALRELRQDHSMNEEERESQIRKFSSYLNRIRELDSKSRIQRRERRSRYYTSDGVNYELLKRIEKKNQSRRSESRGKKQDIDKLMKMAMKLAKKP